MLHTYILCFPQRCKFSNPKGMKEKKRLPFEVEVLSSFSSLALFRLANSVKKKYCLDLWPGWHMCKS